MKKILCLMLALIIASTSIVTLVMADNGSVKEVTSSEIADRKVVIGDIDSDGSLDVVDVVLARSFIVGKKTLTSDEQLKADMNSDGQLDIVDVVIMRQDIINGISTVVVDTDTSTDTETDIDTKTDSDVSTDTDTETDTETDTDTETEIDTDTSTDTTTETDTNTEDVSDTDISSETDTEVISDSDIDTVTDVDTSTDSETTPDEVASTDTEATSDETDFDSNVEIQTQDVTGSTHNKYVSDYIFDAIANYSSDINRSNTVVTNYSKAVSGVRKDEPVPLTVTLPAGRLEVKDNATNITTITEIEGGATDIYNLSKAGGEYTVKNNNGETIATGTLMSTNSLRMIYAPSVYNVRDLGGWDTYKNNGTKEGTIKYGKLFRGSEINNNITIADKKIFNDYLGIRAEIDFYNSYSGEEERSILGDSVLYTKCHTAYHYKNLVDLDNATNLEVIKRAIMATFYAAENDLPLYFHCQVGADRTGTLAFILGAMLGMNEVELDIDWELTSFSATLPASDLVAGWRTRNESGSYGAKYREMIDYFKSCTTNPTSIRDAVVAWAVLAGIDIDDINTFRQNMIDGTPETITANINYNATGISLNKTTAEVGTGETVTIIATVSPSWSTSEVSWSSSDTNVATVSANGKVCTITGVAEGNATITAVCNGLTATCSITVTSKQEEPQYTGNILDTVGYTDGKRYNDSGNVVDKPSAYDTFATGFITFNLQNDGYFKLRLTGTNNQWTNSQSYCKLCMYTNNTFSGYKTLKTDSVDTANGVTVSVIDSNTVELLFSTGTSRTINKIGLSGMNSGVTATIEQIFPIVLS